MISFFTNWTSLGLLRIEWPIFGSADGDHINSDTMTEVNLTMRDSHEHNRRLFLKHLCAAAATTALVGTNFKADALPSAVQHEDCPNTHNMLVFGEKTIYLSHLPMFDGLTANKADYASPHRYQVILEVSFQRNGKDLQNIYSADRGRNPSIRIYTLNPKQFVLPRFVSGNPESAPLTAFKAKVFRGHLENGGRVVPELDDIIVKVNRVIHFRMFDPRADKPGELKYLLFGRVQETFLAHYVSKPPDFDQVLSVKVDGHTFTDVELSKGIELTIPGRLNQASARIKEAETAKGQTQTADGQTLKFNLKAGKVIYFEEGELLMPPTFEDTKLEGAKI
jgi:hypothetical protein